MGTPAYAPLEQFASSLEQFFLTSRDFTDDEKDILIIMSILSNYTPECLVRAEVSCKIEELGKFSNGIDSNLFAEKFSAAIKIAHLDPYRATTHNKGIFNGIDAVALATGNDFRAIEANGHVWAAKSGKYKSLTHASVSNNRFKYKLKRMHG